jgi:ABC-type transport system substrate-binding protein
VEGQIGSYYKFEALDSNWRVVPEFKNVTVRCVPELSTTVAMLKNKEIDMARVTAEQLPDLKASGVATEISTVGGNTLCATWGGILIKEDNRYNPDYHNKDPWTDMRVRKAMTISIDREAICKAIFAGGAFPVGAPLMHPDQKNFQYPYNPTEAKKLLAEAGYPNGFSFKFISYTIPGVPETQRVVEAMAGYWQQIGLDPKITTTDFGRYASLRQQAKMAGEINLIKINQIADMMDRVGGQLMPGSWGPLFEDEASYTLYKEASVKTNAEERIASIAKFNQYYFDNYGPLPIAITAFCFAWNSEKIASFPQAASSSPLYLEYFRHAEPLNTFRLFTPWPGR